MKVIAGKFEIIRPLGEGAYGTVYLVRHVDLGAQFALKILKLSIGDQTRHVERFKREAEILLRFTDRGTVLLRDFGRTDDGQYYMVTDFCDGASLEDLLSQGKKFPLPLVLEIMIQLLQTLEAAHGLGVVHRDIKSANIMLERWNRGSGSLDFDSLTTNDLRVKVLDFGVAKLQEELQGSDQNKTSEGISIGTPAYMSPEQASGEHDLDARVDIYSSGIVLYELLSGATPFEGKSVVQTLLKHLTQPPPPFSHALGVPDYLQAIVFKALEKERDKRYQTASEFRIACEQARKLMGGKPPRRDASSSADPSPTEAAPPEDGAKKRILCLDDNEMILQIMKHLLEKEGFEVTTAANFSIIHDFIFKDKVSLMLCDVQMPGLPGDKICKLLKKVVPDLKIVLFSNIPDRDLEKLALSAQADTWMSKNSSPAEWIKRVKELTAD